MKAIMLMFDTLNRHMLAPYGCDWTHTPNFQRLAEKTVVFDHSYAGSLPCMPARRELHTGRYNFLHRSWGPLEPFDDSMPEILKQNGVYTHLITDHQHYWEDGGCTYHNRYASYEMIRGQEGDAWKGEVADPSHPEMVGGHEGKHLIRQDWINRKYIQREEDFPQAQTIAGGLEFIRTNHMYDSWFLQIETFDPHEPFYAPQKYRDLYPHDYDGLHFDWPAYGPVHESRAEINHCRLEYAALLSMCDHYLGTLLDLMDELDLWKDTMLIVNTDHGLLLSEHNWWGKMTQPIYNEIANTPLFIYDPRCKKQGERRQSLVQMIDMAPTLLEYFNLPVPENMQGHALRETIATDNRIRDFALFGHFGGHVYGTDSRYVYMRGPSTPQNQPLYNYTLMPTHIRRFFSQQELSQAQLSEPLTFTKGLKTLKMPAAPVRAMRDLNTYLFDLKSDPYQNEPLQDSQIEEEMCRKMVELMEQSDAPAEQMVRLGLGRREGT